MVGLALVCVNGSLEGDPQQPTLAAHAELVKSLPVKSMQVMPCSQARPRQTHFWLPPSCSAPLYPNQ